MIEPEPAVVARVEPDADNVREAPDVVAARAVPLALSVSAAVAAVGARLSPDAEKTMLAEPVVGAPAVPVAESVSAAVLV